MAGHSFTECRNFLSAEGQEKEESQNSVLSIKGNDFDEIEKIYNRSQEKYLDMGHLQVLILKNQLVQSEHWKELLAYLEKEPLIGENVYVFRSEYPEQIMKWNKNGSSTGEYLLGILENRIPEQEKNGVTLRQVYQQHYENNTLLDIPEIILQDEEIQVLSGIKICKVCILRTENQFALTDFRR